MRSFVERLSPRGTVGVDQTDRTWGRNAIRSRLTTNKEGRAWRRGFIVARTKE